MTSKLVLFAPNVHTGGGGVLLKAVLEGWPDDQPFTAWLDARARDSLVVPSGATVTWVTASIRSRLMAEFGLRRSARKGDKVLCFHGLPPLLPNDAKVILFQQNRHYFGLNPLSPFSWRTRCRLAFERFVSKAFRSRVAEYIVQTPSMQRALLQWYRAGSSSEQVPVVKVFPFMADLPEVLDKAETRPEWDFVYVADGEAHKNHRVLLAAWQLLAREGLRPSLVLTLGRRDAALQRDLAYASTSEGLQIHNVGQIPHEDILALYGKAKALIFPSISESFGLPLIEAAQKGLPILAPELDYVRDVCIPAQTFDATSPVSIARAVKRFLRIQDAPLRIHKPKDFLELVLDEGVN